MRRAPLLPILLGVTIAAGAGGVQVSGPVAILDPATVDFGTVDQETVHRAAITLRNGGTETLEIHEIDSDCGCTVASIPDSLLAPGDTTVLRVTLSTRHFSGQIAKHVTLKTNDPGAAKTMITLQANVRVTVRVEPVDVEFGAVARGQTPLRTVTITSARSESLRVIEVVVPEETFGAELTEEAKGDSLVYRLTLQLRPDAPLGAFKEKAVLRTTHQLARELRLQVTGQIYSFFRADPPQLSLGQIRQGMSRTRSVRLIGEGQGQRQVQSASCSHERLQVSLETIEEGRVFEIAVTAPEDIEPGRIDAILRVTTNDPDQPEIHIPVRGSVRRARARR